MAIRLFSLALLLATFIGILHADYNKLYFTDCGSKGVEIRETDMTPMPILHPSTGLLTFVVNLLRPVKVLETKLDIIRTVNGIRLPISCYKVNGKDVGSCTYPSLCGLLQDMLDTFNPTDCSPSLQALGIDCRCPFNIPPKLLNIVKEEMNIPDISKTAANFLASGDFNVTITARDLDNGAVVQPYGCGKIAFTVKAAKPGR